MPIPENMKKIHQILVSKNYSEHPLKDEKKRKMDLMSLALGGRFFDNRVENENEIALGLKSRSASRKRKERENKLSAKERIQAAKKFVVHKRGREIWEEDKQYLKLINAQLNKNLDHYFHPSKIKVRADSMNANEESHLSASSLSTPTSSK